MKRIIMITVAAFILSTSVAVAHPPREMEVSYDAQERVLLVKMSHVVRNPTDHRIARIVITKNEKGLKKGFPLKPVLAMS